MPGILVNAIAPGLVATEATDFLTQTDEDRRRAAGRPPLSRSGTLMEVAALGLFFASDEAAWISGVTIAINGGSPVPNAYLEFLDRLADRRE